MTRWLVAYPDQLYDGVTAREAAEKFVQNAGVGVEEGHELVVVEVGADVTYFRFGLHDIDEPTKP